MSAGSVSLEAALRTCKVDTGWASKVQSDRFLNPNIMVCPVWDGFDTAGRMVCPDSFYTKRAGCNSAEDRVVVENNVSRPQYMEYINLNANGISGEIYQNPPYNMNSSYQSTGARSFNLKDTVSPNNPNGTGRFGYVNVQDNGSIIQSCIGSGSGQVELPPPVWGPHTTAYTQGMAQMQQNNRLQAGADLMYEQYKFQQNAGNAPNNHHYKHMPVH